MLTETGRLDGATRDALAAEWGISPASVEQYAVSARQRIRDATDKPSIRRKLTEWLDEGFRMAKSEVVMPAQAASAVAKLVDSYGKLTGAAEHDDAPKVTIAFGQTAQSAVLDAIWGPAAPDTITTEGVEVVEREPAQLPAAEPEAARAEPHVVSADVDAPAPLPDDGWR